MSFLEDLKNFMDEEEVNELQIQTNNSFEIKTMEQAYYFIKKINELKLEKEQIELTAETELEKYITKINSWKEKENNRVNNIIGHYLAILQPFINENLNGKKTLKTPYGTIGYRKQQAKFNYDDEQILKFLQENKPELIETVTNYKYSKTDLKKEGNIINNQLYIDGKCIPGVKVEILPDKFEVK